MFWDPTKWLKSTNIRLWDWQTPGWGSGTGTSADTQFQRVLSVPFYLWKKLTEPCFLKLIVVLIVAWYLKTESANNEIYKTQMPPPTEPRNQWKPNSKQAGTWTPREDQTSAEAPSGAHVKAETSLKRWFRRAENTHVSTSILQNSLLLADDVKVGAGHAWGESGRHGHALHLQRRAWKQKASCLRTFTPPPASFPTI